MCTPVKKKMAHLDDTPLARCFCPRSYLRAVYVGKKRYILWCKWCHRGHPQDHKGIRIPVFIPKIHPGGYRIHNSHVYISQEGYLNCTEHNYAKPRCRYGKPAKEVREDSPYDNWESGEEPEPAHKPKPKPKPSPPIKPEPKSKPRAKPEPKPKPKPTHTPAAEPEPEPKNLPPRRWGRTKRQPGRRVRVGSASTTLEEEDDDDDEDTNTIQTAAEYRASMRHQLNLD